MDTDTAFEDAEKRVYKRGDKYTFEEELVLSCDSKSDFADICSDYSDIIKDESVIFGRGYDGEIILTRLREATPEEIEKFEFEQAEIARRMSDPKYSHYREGTGTW